MSLYGNSSRWAKPHKYRLLSSDTESQSATHTSLEVEPSTRKTKKVPKKVKVFDHPVILRKYAIFDWETDTLTINGDNYTAHFIEHDHHDNAIFEVNIGKAKYTFLIGYINIIEV